MTLKNTNTVSQNRIETNVHSVVLHITQSSRSGASPSDTFCVICRKLHFSKGASYLQQGIRLVSEFQSMNAALILGVRTIITPLSAFSKERRFLKRKS